MRRLTKRGNFLGVPISWFDKAMGFVIVMTVLAACAPLQHATTGGLNSATGDSASLTFVLAPASGLQFDPGQSTALGVLVDVQADEITAYDHALCTPYEYGVDCKLGDVASPTFIRVSGKRVTAGAQYRRVGSSRVYHEFATH